MHLKSLLLLLEARTVHGSLDRSGLPHESESWLHAEQDQQRAEEHRMQLDLQAFLHLLPTLFALHW